MAIESAPSAIKVESRPHDEFPYVELLLRNYLSEADVQRVRSAYEFACQAHAGQSRMNGEPYILHPVSVAEILAEYHRDSDIVIAGLLHDVIEDTKVTYDDVVSRFGKPVADLVQGVTKVSKIVEESPFLREMEVENFRRMLVATAKDIHVIIVKLADRLHNMQTLAHMPREKQLRIAKNTLDIFAPIAHRLGLGKMKWELEDLALVYLHPDMYQMIKKNVSEKRALREQYIREVCRDLQKRLEQHQINGTVEGRAKHFYSIYQKMNNDNKTFEEIFDLAAIRVICESIGECYAVLGEVHSMWRQLDGRFKDYISNPKPNNYRSIHTTVLGPKGRKIEIQIRTLEMHLDSEFGIAAHWRYKEEKNGRIGRDAKWIEQFVNNLPDTHDPEEFIQSIQQDLFSNEVYVYTPKGELIRLVKGATPIDLAYRIHTNLGNRCGGAKVNGRLVTLNYELQTGDVVEILSNPNSHPSAAWLNIVKTSSARNKIRRYLLHSQRDQLLQRGQSSLSRELQKNSIKPLEFYNSPQIKEIVKSLKVKDLDDLFVNIGFGRINTKQVMARVLKLDASPPAKVSPARSRGTKNKAESKPSVVKMGDIDEIMYRRARCCNPLPGEDIIGFVTRGRGVSIHRANCKSIRSHIHDGDRILPLFWEGEDQGHVEASIDITARDRHNLLMEVTQMISATGTNIVGCNTETVNGTAQFHIRMDIRNAMHLDTIMQQLLGIEGVKSIKKSRAKKGNSLSQ